MSKPSFAIQYDSEMRRIGEKNQPMTCLEHIYKILLKTLKPLQIQGRLKKGGNVNSSPDREFLSDFINFRT